MDISKTEDMQTEPAAFPGDSRDEGSAVDLIASAKNAQWTINMLECEQVVKVIAPAKVNLFLNVGDKRADGYHDVVNVMHSLALHDTLYFGRNTEEALKDPESTFSDKDALISRDDVAFGGNESNLIVQIDICDKTAGMYDEPLSVAASENLVFKAIDALARTFEISAREVLKIRIEKAIPHQAGLGGGSADAAAAMVALAYFWGIDSESESFMDVAQDLGADVAFFLKGGCAELGGIGNTFVRDFAPMKKPLVLVKPAAGVSTTDAYKALDENPHVASESLLDALSFADNASDVPLFNSFSEVSKKLDPELGEVFKWLSAQEGVVSSDAIVRTEKTEDMSCAASEKDYRIAKDVLLSGSGAVTFAITETSSDAMRIAAAARTKGWWARASHFCALYAAVMK